MQVLVLGGTRFIGRAIVSRLLREGHTVTLLNRGVTPDPFGTKVRRVVGDRRDPATIERALGRREYEVVVDVTSYHEKDTELLVRLVGDRTGHLIHISTASVYLIRDGLLPPFQEGDFQGRLTPRTSPRDSAWIYAYHKRRAEEALFRAWTSDRVPFTTLRLPMVVGPHDYTLRAEAYLQRLALGGPIILPDGGLNSWGFLWVEDVAEVLVSNLANSAAFGRAYNLAQREALNLRQFVLMAAEALGVEAQLVSVPREWLEAVGMGVGFSPYTHTHDILLDCHAAEEDLLFRPTPAKRWVRELAAWFRRHWDGQLTAFAASRAAELDLAQELARVRLAPRRLVEARGGG